MADNETKRAEKPKEPESSAKDSQASEQTFPVEQLIAAAPNLLDCQPWEAAGGLYGKTGSMAVSEAKSKIQSWLSAPVKEAK